MHTSYGEMKDIIIERERQNNPEPLDIGDLFVDDFPLNVTDLAYYGRANGLGTKTLEMLKEKAKLIVHDDIKTQRGKEKSDYSYATSNASYTFEYNDLILEVHTFVPRSRNKIRFKFVRPMC